MDKTTCLAGVLFLAGACVSGDSPRASETDDAGTSSDDPTTPPDDDGDSAPPSTSVTANPPDDDSADSGDSGSSGDEGDEGESSGDTGGPVDPPLPGMVFTINNADDHNAVVAFARDEEGGLELLGEYLTGGVGSGGGLGSQDSVAIGGEGHVYVVNPGDATISSMAIHEDFLSLVDIADTEGEMPTSLAVGDGRVYVLNAAGAGSVIGFDIDDGMFTPIDGASQPLSGHEAPAPAQIGITPDGDYLVVTERATNQILTYEVAGDGSLQPPVVNASEGMTPFGFGFTSTGVFVVSEAFGGGMNPGASAASSYRVADGGALWTFTASAPSGQTAACWLTIVDDQYAYTTNTGSDTISGYHVSDDGSIELFSVGGDLVELGDDMSPLDMAVSADGAFLYVLNGAGDNIMGFAVEPDGNLGALGDAIEVPAAAVGLAGF